MSDRGFDPPGPPYGGGYGPPPGPYGSPPPGYGAPGYGYPGYGYPGWGGPPPRRTNGLAITSLILGLVGIVACQLFAIAGVIVGIIARRQIRDRDEDGAGLALAGIIVSAIGCAIGIAVAIFFVVLIATAGDSTTPRSGVYRTSTTSRFSTTTERIGVPGTAGGPSTPPLTEAPSGRLPLEVCPRVTLASKNLAEPQNLDNAILTDAARTLHLDLPPEFADDIDTLFSDALQRAGTPRAGRPAGDAAAAFDRIATFIDDACPVAPR